MSQIFKRPRARADLAEIRDYIAEDSEARADAFIESIGQKLQTLGHPGAAAVSYAAELPIIGLSPVRRHGNTYFPAFYF